jgi:mono/diheme cytochrome c family protein
MPKWFNSLVLIMAALSLIPISMVYLRRSEPTDVPRVSIIPDMDNQPRWKTQMYYPLFADNRVSRPPVEGTVARGMLQDDDHLAYGIVNGHWASSFPPQLTINDEFLNRGQKNYEIYCSMCHGIDGYGNGIVAQRAADIALDPLRNVGGASMTWTQPLDYHSDAVRARPVGHLYNTITHGIRTMPAYASQITRAEDRWAVVAYVRALQLSQHAPLEMVPADQRDMLQANLEKEAAEAAALAEDQVTGEDQAAQPDEQPSAAGDNSPANSAEGVSE